jgi:predicted HicB family RNase H-like nuclease
MLEYQGYTGRVEFDAQAGIFHGEVLDTRDVITFQGRSVKELQKAFRDSIDDYVEFCADSDEHVRVRKDRRSRYRNPRSLDSAEHLHRFSGATWTAPSSGRHRNTTPRLLQCW